MVHLFKRNLVVAFRNPLQLCAVVALGVIQSFFIASLFGGIGSEPLNLRKRAEFVSGVTNILGLVFLATSDQFIICAFGMILLLPMAYPVYRREMGSRMYSATAYFFASTLSNICVYAFYPLLVSCFTFYFYEFEDDSFGAFMLWLSIQFVMAVAGICFG